MSKGFWKEFEKIVRQIGPELKRLSKTIEMEKLSEEVHEKIIRQIFPNAIDERVDFIVRDFSLINPISYSRWCSRKLLTIGTEESYDSYSMGAREVINDPNPLGRAISCKPGIIVIDEYYRFMTKSVTQNHERLMEIWELRIAPERREFEKTLKAWVGLFVTDESVSEHYYQIISHVLSSYYISNKKSRRAIK